MQRNPACFHTFFYSAKKEQTCISKSAPDCRKSLTIQKNFLPNQNTKTALLAYSTVCKAVIVVDISGLFADIALTVEASSAMCTEDFPLEDVGSVLTDYPLLALLCGFVQYALDGFKQLMADNGFVGSLLLCKK